MSDLTIRPERPGDEPAIFDVTEAAFTGHPHSEGTEPAIVDALRAAGDLALSLVAERDGEIVGHVAYSPAILSGGEEGWLALGPISVHPKLQGHGIGRALVEAGSEYWQRAGAQGLVLLGDPALYSRFGFVRETPLHITGPLAEYFQALPFTDAVPDSSVTFAPAFRLARPTNR
ncbi:N-acetyltransferase [Croceibacterium sp. LX-88]|uniref:N-acetyltransferase n=1 Tax=Croceibacterium selenioxidans TaxID=2838833 RepID=A0ABS5W827_9SPHN|nr:N-acetyltransferase [Croceibacterium selenioxidans]MBT2135472.1 N-acetyltransferase [Croceibacterium selenioxidans]